jgi:dTDP-glucose 4,6-dehydratase
MNRLLVTGGAGFIGSGFVRYVLEQNPELEVVVLDALTYAGRRENLDLSDSRIKLVERDIRDRELVARSLHGVDAVVHFAAESHVDRSLENPDLFWQVNVEGTRILAEEAARRSIRFHHVSTDEVFGELPYKGDERFTEESLYRPTTPYAQSKAKSDQVVRGIGRSMGLSYTISNCGNNYGPRQQVEKFIPRAITNLLHSQPVKLWNHGRNIRDWIHVDDHCAAIWQILLCGQIGETYLVGANGARSNLQVARTLCSLLEVDSKQMIEFTGGDRPVHDQRYELDAGKLHQELGWSPGVDFDDGLEQTIYWYERNRRWWATDKDATEADYAKRGR